MSVTSLSPTRLFPPGIVQKAMPTHFVTRMSTSEPSLPPGDQFHNHPHATVANCYITMYYITSRGSIVMLDVDKQSPRSLTILLKRLWHTPKPQVVKLVSLPFVFASQIKPHFYTLLSYVND